MRSHLKTWGLWLLIGVPPFILLQFTVGLTPLTASLLGFAAMGIVLIIED